MSQDFNSNDDAFSCQQISVCEKMSKICSAPVLSQDAVLCPTGGNPRNILILSTVTYSSLDRRWVWRDDSLPRHCASPENKSILLENQQSTNFAYYSEHMNLLVLKNFYSALTPQGFLLYSKFLLSK